MSEASSSSTGRRYRATTADQAREIAFTPEGVTIDGRPVDATFDALGGHRYVLHLDGRSIPVIVESTAGDAVRLTAGGRSFDVRIQDERALLMERFGMAAGTASAVRQVRAPMPGLVLSVAVEPGQTVTAGTGLLVLEAMKMENELRAEADGVVRAVHVAPGEAVGKNALLVEFES